MTPKLEETLRRAVESLQHELTTNLYSCCLYGSSVRGNAIDGVSDLNLLIVVNCSDAEAHGAIARALEKHPVVDPFVLGRGGFHRSVRAFASKFASIKRNYRVLAGSDPLSDVIIAPEMERFLCEQALRNFRLRLVFSFVTRKRHTAYDRFVVRNCTGLFVQFSETLRLEGTAIPTAFTDRIPIFEREFKIDGQVLRDILELKKKPRRLSDDDVVRLHQRLFPVIVAVVDWIESHWAE